MKKLIFFALGGTLLLGTMKATPSFSEEQNLEKWTDRINIGVLLETEVSYSKTDLTTGGDTTTSDIVLATAELDIGVEIHEKVYGQLNYLYEEDDTPLGVDVGTITVGDFNGVSVTVGQMYVPFGMFNSHFISDQMTLLLGETNESAVVVAYSTDMLTVQAGLFNGTTKKYEDDDAIDDFVSSIEVTPVKQVTFGASYMSDISDSDTLEGESGLADDYVDRVGGVSVFVSATFGPVTLEGEYMGATDKFDSADLDNNMDSNGDKPKTFNIEAAYSVNDKLEVAIRIEGNDEFFGNPESQYGVAASYSIWDGVTGSVELLQGEYASDDPDNNDDRTLITAQLSLVWP